MRLVREATAPVAAELVLGRSIQGGHNAVAMAALPWEDIDVRCPG